MWFTRLAISRPVLIWMALTAIAVLGLRAYTRLPAELNPKVDIPTLTVTTIYPGVEPPEIETQISKPLEDAVGTVPGVRDVYSSSQSGVSIISMDFKVGTDLDAAAAEVRGRVEAVRAQLPAEARPPVVAKLDINALPILYLGLECPSLNLQQLRALADNTLRPRLERVPGVATVRVVGGQQREIHIEVDARRLAPLGLTIVDVVNSIKAGGHDVPGGDITQIRHETGVRLSAAFDSLDSIAGTPLIASQLMMRSARPGSASALPTPPLTVADVAEVSDGTAERTEINRINGHDGISLVLTKASDANTVAVVDEANVALEQLKPSLPHDLRRIVLRDDSVTVRDALQDVNGSLLLGAAMAMVVILFFLHNVRGTLIVSLAIPACIVATFLVMSIAGFTLNQMTLLALSLSVGILVDDSIVVLESITRHLKNGETPREAAFNGRSEIGFADITTTLVDVVVFVPIAFMGGVVGG
ncbi:MAG: Cation/multidrug efflux pump, partial [Chthonomonadaceae bacterium]|nr:Cation/multidrug efflux pump [Chthonomonadaceae bacterium]